MSDATKIEWTDTTWNPVTGCTKVSPGCDHCYAETITERFHGKGSFANVTLHPDRLDKPLHWRKPRKVFVNSMSDLFHDDVPDEYIARVFAVMAAAPRHAFQILTKRHGRMRSLLNSDDFRHNVANEASERSGEPPFDPCPTFHRVLDVWPLRNVWLGVSVENQQWADIRIPALLDTPAAVRFLSCEPLLGPVNLIGSGGRGVYALPDPPERDGGDSVCQDHGVERCTQGCAFVDWVIVGGESGRGARPMRPDWARSLRDQCVAAGVPFLFKQWGEHLGVRTPSGEHTERVGKKAAGRELDGRTWDEYPEAVS